MLDPTELKFRTFLVIIGPVVFFFGLIWLHLADRRTSNEFPQISHEEHLLDTVTGRLPERSYLRVWFSSGKQRTIYESLNNAYKTENLVKLISVNDIIVKKRGEDTVRVVRGNDTYVFLLEREISFPDSAKSR